MRTAKIGEVTQFRFGLAALGGITEKQSGVTDLEWTKVVFKGSATDALTADEVPAPWGLVTVTEIGSTGEYVATMTFPSAGLWKVDLVPPDESQRITEEFVVVAVLPTDRPGRAL